MVYDKDPNKYSDALMYDEITFDEVLEKELGVMDLEAMEICRDSAKYKLEVYKK